ncbi:mediator of DNA damage checkpoint protein 1-like [Mizuhopecten yessoensis]|uniref:Mediator of DNA damage checkpoint protein 1 n=1 Tax=Mizuhopecten yessoensis TaxID=6573 RepID=A0A210PNR2_MIZYE|nr:mediator of DNA damage checkpoint protein 1-like [Mizuhopecten yessoensis]XP_021378883.1 mediator of DNA damage checkpoint protein 1-like [Mizuhopecten yessoensis]OWF38145.1 Mediator of DNA damage checkpoint protein 1 [Mizuhopecten yessoensis]
MDLEQTQALDFGGDFDDEDETDDEEAVKRPVAHLKVKSQKEFEEKVFEINEGDNVVGRHEITCSIWIPLKALSREHACIEVKGDSHFIYDKGSRNKTRRGKAVLKPDVRYELTNNTSVTFGDVEAVYYIGEEINDKGSETGSESFQTAPMEDEGMNGKEGAAGVTLLVTEEEEEDSDASVDLLQPTQAYHGGRTLNLAPDSDEEEGPQHTPNVTVQDTPLPPKRTGAVGATAMSTLVLPESDTDDEEEDRRKARALQSLQTQVVTDTQQDDDEEEEEEGEENNNVNPAMFGATQAYVMESEADDDATDDENTRNVSPAIFAAETQAFGEESDDKKDDDQPIMTFVADSDEDSDVENGEAVMDDDTEGEDDNVDVSHIFAASTLACDMVDEEEEQASVDLADNDDNVATQMVEEDATEVVEATKKIAEDEEEGTQVIEEEGDSENITTQCLEEATVAITEVNPIAVTTGDATVAVQEGETMAITDTETFSVKNDATVAVTEDATMAVTEDATMAVTDDPTMAVTEDPTMFVTEDATMAVTEDATMAVTDDPTMAVTEDPTVAVTDDPTMAVTEDPTVAVTEDATMAVTEDDTMAVTEDATMAVTEDATMTVTEDVTMAVTEDATMAVEAREDVTEATMAVNEEAATQVVDNVADFENDATQVIEDESEHEKHNHKKKSGRGRQGRKSKTNDGIEEDATQVLDDATAGDYGATLVAEDINNPQETPKENISRRGRRGKAGKVPEGDTNKTESDTTEDEATQVIDDDVSIESEVQEKVSNKPKTGVGKGRKSKAREVFEEEATQVVEDPDLGEDQATQVIEDVSADTPKESTGTVKGRRGRPGKRGKKKEITEDEATQVLEDESTEVPEEHKPSSRLGRSKEGETTKGKKTAEETDVSGGEEATQVYGLEVDEEELAQPRGRSGRVKKSSPRRGTDRVQKDLVNLPALKPSREETDPAACMDVEPATQMYGEDSDEEDTPPLSEEVVQDSENVLGKSPIIPLPPNSPHKSALASPRKRSKSPSPKRVKFAIESQSSESTVGEEEEKAGPSTGHTATRSKLTQAGVKVKTTVTRGRRSLPATAVKEKKEIASRLSKGRRSLPASDLDNVSSKKKGKKEKMEKEDIKEDEYKEPEVVVEPTTAGKRGGRRSVGVKVNEEPNVKGKGRNSATVEKEEMNVTENKGTERGKHSTKFESEKDAEEKENEAGQSTVDSTESKVEASVEEVRGRGRGRRSIQAGGSGDCSTIEKNKEKTTKLVRIVGKRKQAVAEEPASNESTPDVLVQAEDSPSVKEEEVKGRTSSRGRKSKQAAEESKSTEKAQENQPISEVVEKGKKTSRGRRSTQLAEEETKEEEVVEEKNVPAGGRGKKSKLKPLEEEDTPKSAEEEGEEFISNSKHECKNDKEVKDTSEDKLGGPVASTSRGRRSKQVSNISDSVEPIEEKTGRTAGSRSKKREASHEEMSPTEVVSEQENRRRTGRGSIQGRKSKQVVEEKEDETVKETAEVTEPPKPRRGTRGKKATEPFQEVSAENEDVSAADLANMSGISKRKPRGRVKKIEEVMSVDSKIEKRTSRGKGNQTVNVSMDSEKTEEESQSEVSASRQTKAKGANKTKEENVSKGRSKTQEDSVAKGKTSKEENTQEESELEQSKIRTKGRGKASNSKEDVDVTKGNEESDSGDVRKDRGRKANTSVSVSDQEGADPGTSRKGKTATRGKRGHSQEQDVVETPAKKIRDETDLGTPVQSKKDVLAVDSPTLRRKSMDPKPRVMFTGMVNEQGQKTVKDLGGEMVTSVQTCTHLVTDKVRRTVKLLCCLSRGIPIVLPTWLSSSKQTGTFIQDVTPYLVKDTATEKQYKFSLQRSIERASQASVLLDYNIHVTKSVRPDPTQMKDIVECAGAVYLESMPCKFAEKTVVVSCEEDQKLCQVAMKADIPVVNAEFVLTGILQQDANPSNYQIFNNSKKRPADSSAEGPSKRRRR